MHRSSLVMRAAKAFLLSIAVATPALAEQTPAAGLAPVHGLPEIIAINMPATRDFHAGQTIRGSVETTPNVGYVEARIQYRNQALHRDGLGKFSLAYTIPWWLPPWLRHGWTLQIIARSIDGIEVKKEFPITIH